MAIYFELLCVCQHGLALWHKSKLR